VAVFATIARTNMHFFVPLMMNKSDNVLPRMRHLEPQQGVSVV
jgi:hypothetical protein